MISEPTRPTALAMSGHVAMVRATRTFARRRWLAHHGTDSTRAPMASACWSGAASGPTAAASVSKVLHASTVTAASSRSSRMGMPNLAPKATSGAAARRRSGAPRAGLSLRKARPPRPRRPSWQRD